MKKALVVFILIVLAGKINAEEERFSLQTKPLMYIAYGIASDIEEITAPFVFVDIEFLYAQNRNIALFVNPIFFTKGFSSHTISGSAIETTYFSSNCIDLVIGLLYHPGGNWLRGMYLGAFPIIGWGYVTNDGKNISNFLNIGYMAEIGYRWIFNKGFTITLGTGISKLYQIPKESIITAVNSTETGIGNDRYHYDNFFGLNLWNLPIDPRIKFSIGYSF